MMVNREQPAKLRVCWLACALIVFFGSMSRSLHAQDPRAGNPLRSAPSLAEEESRVAERYNRLELLAGRLAELSRSTQPRRARLLRELVSKSREQDLAGRFDRIVKALQEDRLANATENQGQLQTELQKLLNLLLQEDRDRQIESERKRISKYLANLKKLIRLQRGIQARTEGGDEAKKLTDDQQRVAQATGKLRDQIETNENTSKPAPGKDTSSDQSPPGEKKPSQETPSEGNTGKPGKPQPGQGSPSEGKSDSEKSEQNAEPTPAQQASKRLQQARKRMQRATEHLEQANRKEAVEEQERALRELEQAKAELERILRQLREEELERMLVLLEARLRKMLDAQVEVYEQTQTLNTTEANVQTHEQEIASGRLSRKEQQIIRDAERALLLLREDGTSVAFPEALEQAREDMQTVAQRLAEVKLGMLTEGLEEDIIATLEEILAALQQAIKDLREQRAKQQQSGGPPGEQPLVDQLAELRMIRALQMRINRRTQRYGKMIDGQQALEKDLLEALDQLALRQERVFEATHDLDTGRNQ